MGPLKTTIEIIGGQKYYTLEIKVLGEDEGIDTKTSYKTLLRRETKEVADRYISELMNDLKGIASEIK